MNSEIIASTKGKLPSVVMGDVCKALKRGFLKVIWLAPLAGKT
jgi:hypothetical protein